MHIYSLNDLKFTLKHLKRSYMFRSYDHLSGSILCFLLKLQFKKNTLIDLHRHVEKITECF